MAGHRKPDQRRDDRCVTGGHLRHSKFLPFAPARGSPPKATSKLVKSLANLIGGAVQFRSVSVILSSVTQVERRRSFSHDCQSPSTGTDENTRSANQA